MVASWVAPAIVGGGQLLSGILGNRARQSGIKADQAAMNEAIARIMGVSIPEAERLVFQNPQLVGELAPQIEKEIALSAGPSAMEGITTDPRFAQAQMDALARMQEVGREGMTEEDKLALAQIRQKQGRDAAARQQAILQSMAQRGMGGAGQELAARLSAEQAAADTAAMQGQQVAAEKQRRALEAMMQSGQMAGQMRGQQFGEKSAAAKAKDIMSQFNTQLAAKAQSDNINRMMQAKLRDLNVGQELANERARLANEAMKMERDEAYKTAQMKLGQAGATMPTTGFGQKSGEAQAGLFAGIAGALGQAGAGYMKGQQAGEERAWKEDMLKKYGKYT